LVKSCIAVDNQGNCTAFSDTAAPGDPTKVHVRSDGNDSIFGDLGNDWLVGGTSHNENKPAGWDAVGSPTAGRPFVIQGDTLWGGWGNDLLNVDDDLSTGCTHYGNGNKCDSTGSSYLGDVPDDINSAYQDRAFGGAGLDILIGNSSGDRLIDWV